MSKTPSVKEDTMDPKRLMIGVTIVVALTIISIGGGNLFFKSRFAQQSASASDQPIIDITYCDVEPSQLCVLSFGLDSDDRMLISFITPQPSFPNFYLKIQSAESEDLYGCQKVEAFPTSVYCTGERISLGETIDIEVYSKISDRLIARGKFVVSAIALPTLRIVVMTPSPFQTLTIGVMTPSPFQTLTITATATTAYSYPNP